MNTTFDKKILVLAGSGEFTKSMKEIDQYLLSLTKSAKPEVAILPTAAGLEDTPQKWIDDGIRYFKKLGAKPKGIKILQRKDTKNESLLAELNTSSIIYFSGGHPGYLLTTLKNTPAWKKIEKLYQNRVVLAGSSAGAMIMGKIILANAQEVFLKGEKKFIWKKAFSLVPFSIIPHYDFTIQKWPKVVREVIERAPSEFAKYHIGIDEDTAVIIEDNKYAKVMGKGKVFVFKNGKEKIYREKGSFII